MLNLVKEIEGEELSGCFGTGTHRVLVADVREGSGHAAWIIGTHDSMLFFNPPLTRVMFQQDSWLSPVRQSEIRCCY